MFEKDQLLQVAPFIAIIGVITLFLWWLLARTARRARRYLQELLQAEQSTLADVNDRAFAAIQRRQTALKLVVNTARYVLFFGAGLMILHQLGVKLDSLVLPAGFFGAALGLGAQSLIKDVVAGLFIIFEGQFSVGDVVSINGNLGTIEEVGLRVTRLRDDNGQLYFFPNGSITAVAKYPSRHVALDLWIELNNEAQRDAAQSVVARAIDELETRYDLLEGTPNLIKPADTARGESILHYRLLARPARTATAREKLPPSLIRALQAADISLKTEAPVEITNAPV